MKFYGKGIVWNAQANRPLCKFENGELITEDTIIINELMGLGYKYDVEKIEITTLGDAEEKYIEVIRDSTLADLKALAKEKNIKGYGIMNIATLTKKLKEVES